MADSSDWKTSTTLLRRLRELPQDQEAWHEFVDRYGRLMYRWCRGWGLQGADAEDVTQNVLLELIRQMQAFEYDPAGSFRGWLKTVAQRAWGRYLSSQRRLPRGGDAVLTAEAGDDLARWIEREHDLERFELASQRVRLRVQPHTWEAFRLLALENQAGESVARALDMNLGAVYVARGKVQKMIRDELQHLGGEEDSA